MTKWQFWTILMVLGVCQCLHDQNQGLSSDEQDRYVRGFGGGQGGEENDERRSIHSDKEKDAEHWDSDEEEAPVRLRRAKSKSKTSSPEYYYYSEAYPDYYDDDQYPVDSDWLYQGQDGHVYVRGPMGPEGLGGFPGLTGRPGLPGPKGSQGLPGIDGEKGDQGLPAMPGMPVPPPRGLPGQDGQPGRPGARGSYGPKGDHGLDGLQGRPGYPGLPGLKGDPGNEGIPGIRGRPGSPCPDDCSQSGTTGTTKAPVIAFSGQSLGVGDPSDDFRALDFDKTFVDVGDFFDTRKSDFSAPRKGFYFFSISTMAEGNSAVPISLLYKGEEVISTNSDGTQLVYPVGTNKIVLELKQGDVVSLRVPPKTGNFIDTLLSQAYSETDVTVASYFIQ